MGDQKYGICLQPCNIQLMPIFMNSTGCLSAGALFLIQQRNMNCTAQIKRVDYNNKRHINYENETYICDSKHFKEIDHQLFLLLLAVKPEKRYQLIQDDPLLMFIRNLRENQRVSIPKTSIYGRQNDLDCVVRYIGPVPEIGLGIFFGFIIIDPFDSIPVKGTLGQKYLRCDNSKGFLRSCDVFYKRSQPHHLNQLRSFPSGSSLDPFGSMESLSSERSFGNANQRRQRNRNNANNTRNKGMPVYNADNSSGSGMNLINFEPVHSNFIQPNKQLIQTRPAIDNSNNLGRNFSNLRFTNDRAPSTKISPPVEFELLNFTPVPENRYVLPKSMLRQKYELLKKELDNLKNNKGKQSNDAAGLNKVQGAASRNQMQVVPQKKYQCSLKSCNIQKKFQRRGDNDYQWDGHTEFYTNSIHQVKCYECHQLKLKCYTSKSYGTNGEYNAFITLLRESGFNVSVPENKYLAVTKQDKTKVIDLDKKRDEYYECTIRANITINKNRFKSQCKKCGTAVDTSQGISLVSCHHVFCSNCIKAHIHSSKTPVMKCPIAKCTHKLVENEIHAFMSESEFIIHLQQLQKIAKFNPDDKMFYCKNTSCCGCIEINRMNRDKIVLFYCPECGQFNCIDCNAIHTGITCEEYQRKNNALIISAVAASTTINTGARTKAIIFKCKTGKCSGYLQFQSNEANNFKACPECGLINCRSCEDIHTNSTCRENQNRGASRGDSKTDFNDEEWICSNCTYIHNEKMKNCSMCFNQRMTNHGLEYTENEFLKENDSEDNDDIESISSMDNQYEKMLELEEMDIIRNTSQFECITCFEQIDAGKGVKLHDCLHEFCEECLVGVIKASNQAPVTCPYSNNDFVCEGTIQHREMKYLIDDDMYEQYLYRSVLQAQKDLTNCFQCKTADCRGMWEYEDNVGCYKCPLCKQVNCHQCNAVHDTMSCRDYQAKVFEETNPDALATRKMYEEMFATGKALHCPQCKIVIVREEGCSWVLCIICKTEICWATRGPRWGPKGKGDTSGGCRCDYKSGKPCHPDCGYCH